MLFADDRVKVDNPGFFNPVFCCTDTFDTLATPVNLYHGQKIKRDDLKRMIEGSRKSHPELTVLTARDAKGNEVSYSLLVVYMNMRRCKYKHLITQVRYVSQSEGEVSFVPDPDYTGVLQYDWC